VDTAHVARVFGHIWPHFCGDQVDIDLVPFWYGDKHASPFAAAVVWDSDRWYIVADVKEEPRRLLEILFHELKHILSGDVSKSGYGREVLRAAATGCLTSVPVASTVKRSVRETKTTAVARYREVGHSDIPGAAVGLAQSAAVPGSFFLIAGSEQAKS